MFALVNPEGSTEAGQTALKVADQVATHVDKAVVDQFSHMTEQISAWSITAPEKALQGKQYLYELSKTLKLTGSELEYAGIPKGYFSDLRGAEVSEQLIESKADDHILRMAPYLEHGKAVPIKLDRVSELTGLPEKQVRKLVKQNPDVLEQMTNGQVIYMDKVYRDIYLEAHPQYLGIDATIEVHHKLPQELLTRHPDWFSPKEIHNVENLVGIPKSSATHDLISEEWRIFWQNNSSATKQKILDLAKSIDNKYGKDYLP